jgi:anhydro-N-acetylmuramic acid kinase
VRGSVSLVAGLMSGTSLDGVDAALLRVRGSVPEELEVELAAFATTPYESSFRDRLLAAVEGGGPRELARLHRDLALRFARSLLALLAGEGMEPRELTAVGSHGQTFWHDPPDGSRGCSLQLGCPQTLAEETGLPVVSDFRSRDLAAGGHGAPLVPWADWVLFRVPGRGRALQNVGGMGNVTYLPADGGLEGVRAFDTGPGVALIDAAARMASGGREAWDVDGRRALRGRAREEVVDRLLQDPFFARTPPRSTGREHFGEAMVRELVEREGPGSEEAWDDLLATLTALTARSIAGAYRAFLPPGGVEEVVVTGGGARNPALVRSLTRLVDPVPVRTGSEALGMDPDAREAAAFALLAWAHLAGVPGNVPGATGARGPRVLGSLTPGARAGEGARGSGAPGPGVEGAWEPEGEGG